MLIRFKVLTSTSIKLSINLTGSNQLSSNFLEVYKANPLLQRLSHNINKIFKKLYQFNKSFFYSTNKMILQTNSIIKYHGLMVNLSSLNLKKAISQENN